MQGEPKTGTANCYYHNCLSGQSCASDLKCFREEPLKIEQEISHERTDSYSTSIY